MKRNKVDEVSFIGGLIGFLFFSPRGAVDRRVQEANKAGWTVVQIAPTSGTNFFLAVLRMALLVLTLGLFTFGDGMYIVFEKDE